MKSMISLMITALFFISSVHASEALAPPSINDNTSGLSTPLDSTDKTKDQIKQQDNAENSDTDTAKSLETKQTGAKGYVHGLEIGHSNTNVQYMEDTDRDGQIQKKTSELDETTELPKWKLGSW